MSNTVKTFDVAFGRPDKVTDIYAVIDTLHPDIDAATIVLRTLLKGSYHWAYGMMDYVLTFDDDTQIFSLISNNLVA